jgi:hypothetical protein
MDATDRCQVISPYPVLRLTTPILRENVCPPSYPRAAIRKKDIGQDQGRHSEGCIALAQRLRSPTANCRDSGHKSRMRVEHRAQQPVLSDHIDIESRKNVSMHGR